MSIVINRSTLVHEVNTQLIEAMKSNTVVPWQQPWTDVSCVMPANIATKLPYRDINPILLRIAAKKHGYLSRWWGTELQWRIMGGKVKLDAQRVRVFRKEIQPGGLASVVKEQVVFNLDSVEGGNFDKLRVIPDVNLLAEATGWQMEAGRGLANIEAERIIKATGADFREEPRNGALYYRPPLDYIVVPQMSQFYFGPGGPASYYATAFHEIGHWTENRLAWYADPKLSVKKRYALGELRADICSAYVCAALGIPPQKDELNFDRRSNFAKYCKHWVAMMEEDNVVIFRIAKAASEAADFIISFVDRNRTEGRRESMSKPQESPGKSASDTGTGAGQLEYSFFERVGGMPPSPEARRAYLNPNRGPTQKYPAPSPYYGFIGNRDAVKLLMGIDFDALGKYNHLCRDVAFAFVGPHGCGKTDLARRHAKANMLPLVELSPRSIKTAQDILEELKRVWKSHNMPLIEVCRPKLYKVPPTNVLIDDVDASSLQPLLATVLTDSVMTQSTMITEQGYTVDVQNLHWMVAATDFSNMPPLFSQRFTAVTFAPYTEDEIAQVVQMNHSDWEMAICKLVAHSSPNVPGEALGFAKEMLLAYDVNPGPWDQIVTRVEEQRKAASMSINVQCLSCKGKCHVAQDWLGHAVECPFCHKTFKAVAIEKDSEIIPDDLDLALDDVPEVQPANDLDIETEFALDEEPEVQPISGPDSKIIPVNKATDVQPSTEPEVDDFALDDEPVVQPSTGPHSDVIRLGNESEAERPSEDNSDLDIDEEPEAQPSNTAMNYNCPHCGQTFSSASPAGTVVSCYYCRQNVTLLPPTNEQKVVKANLDDVPEILPVTNTSQPEVAAKEHVQKSGKKKRKRKMPEPTPCQQPTKQLPKSTSGFFGWLFGIPLQATCPKCQEVVYWGPCGNCNGTDWQRADISSYLTWYQVWYYTAGALKCTNCGVQYPAWQCKCGCWLRASLFSKDVGNNFRLGE